MRKITLMMSFCLFFLTGVMTANAQTSKTSDAPANVETTALDSENLDGKVFTLSIPYGNDIMYAFANVDGEKFDAITTGWEKNESKNNKYWTFKKQEEGGYKLYNPTTGYYAKEAVVDQVIALTKNVDEAVAYAVEAPTTESGQTYYIKCSNGVYMALGDGGTRGRNKENATLITMTDMCFCPEPGKFYRIVAAGNTAQSLYENYDAKLDGNNALYNGEVENNIAPALWQFEPCTDEGKRDLFYIKSVNSGNYMSRTVWVYQMRVLEKTHADVGLYDIFNTEHRYMSNAITLVHYYYDNSNKIYDRGTVCANNDGTVSSWNAAEGQNNWLIEEAKEIPVSVSAAGYATLNLPFAVTIPANMEAYIGAEEYSTTVINLTQVETTIPANTPVILRAAEGTYYFPIAYGNEDGALADNVFSGTTVPETIGAGNLYVLKNGGKGIGMYMVDGDRNVPANKAYYMTSEGNANAKTFAFGNKPTGIEDAVAGEKAESNVYYDLNGRPVLYPAKGIYVKANGQKVFIK